MAQARLAELRSEYHRNLCSSILGYRKEKEGSRRALSVADSDNAASIEIADGLARRLGHKVSDAPKEGQSAGSIFTKYTMGFLKGGFEFLQHLRPGSWDFSESQGKLGIAVYDQYEHLAELQRVLKAHKDIASAIGIDYLITPDIVVARRPLDDEEINKGPKGSVVDAGDGVAKLTPLRRANSKVTKAILHASISCKWTIRSDRAQNTRTEALNLIRNRKGRTPHIASVTMEPLPSRLASIAMGTGDVDCTYHGALYELMESVKEFGNADSMEMLNILVEGRRLRDISDLPFDLMT